MSKNLKRKKNVHLLLAGVVLLLLAVYGLSTVKIASANYVTAQMAETFLKQTEKFYLPGFSYLENGQSNPYQDWLAGSFSRLIPLGSYMEEKKVAQTDVEDSLTYEMILKQQAGDENEVDENGKLVKGEDNSAETIHTSGVPIDTSIEKMKDFNYLLSNFYTVDSSTMIENGELNGEELLGKNVKLNQDVKGPKVLIYHSHSQEMFADSVPGDVNSSIVGVGNYLTTLLNDTYHIPTLHHTGVYDLIDGELDRSKAYDLAQPEVERILAENPSIEVVIDLHRDGVKEGTKLVTEVNGKQTAQIMFFNGLSKTRTNGDIDYLSNPFIKDNLAFSLQMQVAANHSYPGFARRIYLRGYRYNMHLMPKYLLIEAGAQTNTVAEMNNAMEVLADTLHTVLVE